MNGFDHLDMEWLAAKPGVKWSRVAPGALAAWVADMDFPIPDVVAGAIRRVLDGGDLGYPNLDAGNPLAEPFAARMNERHGWRPDATRVWAFTDVLNAVQAILELTTEPGDGVAVHTPTYPPFPTTIAQMQRRLVPMRFVALDDGWGLDEEDAASAMASSKVLLLVNPHNPTGRVLSRTELESLAADAEANDLLVISDEVHAELLYGNAVHIPFATVSDDAASRTITISSASKTFNLAGIRTAVAHVGHDRAWRAISARPEHMWGVVGNLSIAATLAAWHEGDAWLEGLRRRLTENRSRITRVLADALPEVRWHPPEGTYLAWLDFRALGLGEDPASFFGDKAAIELSPGPDFGPEGSGFARLNFATAPNVLDTVLERMIGALDGELG